MSTAPRGLAELVRTEDWWAVWIGFALIAAVLVGDIPTVASAVKWPGVLRAGSWSNDPLAAVPAGERDRALMAAIVLLVSLATLTAVAVAAMGGGVRAYVGGFVFVFLIAVVAHVIGHQQQLAAWGLGEEFWAIVLGLAIANTVGTPVWLLAGARGELFIKIGLVLLGAELLVEQIVRLGAPGLLVAWMVTPAVIVFMWLLGTRWLRIPSPSLVMVIACSTSVCGVSAAIASAAACRAKREELTLAVGMTMIFTVGMMFGMPVLCRAMGLDEFIGGAWIGGTVDSTGAVAAAGALLGPTAEKVAAVVKMIQNTLIGLIAFLIALYWVMAVERDRSAARPSPLEIWRRFPKFVLGFLGASLIFSFILLPLLGEEPVKSALKTTKGLRGWWFTLAFCAIGLESNFRRLAAQLVGGKPIVLYLVGQSFNVVLTLVAAYLAFGGRLLPLPALSD